MRGDRAKLTDGAYLRRRNLHQNPGETLHIRRLQNALERPGDRSRPTPRRLASVIVADAFAGELTRGSIGTVPATVETENTRSYQGGLWLPFLDPFAHGGSFRYKIEGKPD
jgi:hypothetical protein